MMMITTLLASAGLFWMLSTAGNGTEKKAKSGAGLKLLEDDLGDAGSDSATEPSVAQSDAQGCEDDEGCEEYDEEGYFCDRAYPPGVEALGDMTGDSANKAKGKVDSWQEDMLPGWARPHQMVGEKKTKTHSLYGMDDVEPCLFGQTAPNDLRQGSIGDCWLITAMSSIAEFPSLVQRLFKQQELASDGRYDIRLYDEETETWRVVTIDDRLPFMKKPGYYGRLLFCKPSLEGEFWPCLLEKAFAKFLDGYWRLEGGFIGVALVALTGKPSVYLDISLEGAHSAFDFYYGEEWDGSAHKCILMRNPGKDKNWSTWSSSPPQAVWESMGEDTSVESIDDDVFWEKLKDWDGKGFIMGCSSRQNYNGIIKGHAYSILQVVEVGDLRLLKIRNPHAGNEWSGAFSDADEESWNANPDALEACNHEVGAQEDGFFWMPFDEFKNGFKKFHLSLQPNRTEDGSEIPRYDTIEKGHSFSDEELAVNGPAWDSDPTEDDANSEPDIDQQSGGDPDEVKVQIDNLVGNIKTLWSNLKDLPPGDERKNVLKSINRKGRRLAAAWLMNQMV